MELDFDKEIDALIRREAAGRTITISERAGLHLDADEIAAFAEGVVPDRARQTFMLHFSECDSCRKTLSNLIALNADEIAEPLRGVAAPAVESLPVPWYRRFFLFPNLAYVMGGLVVLFAGFIGLSVLTYRSGQSEVSMSRPEERQQLPASDAQPSTAAPLANANASTASSSNTTLNAANSAANIPFGGSADVPEATPADTAVARQEPAIANERELKDRQPAAATPAPPPPSRDNAFVADGLAARRAQETRPTVAERDKKVEESKIITQATPLPRSGAILSKEKGPMRNDSRERNSAVDAEKARAARKTDAAPSLGGGLPGGGKSVAGRMFVFRQGAWYDTIYQGQGTVNVRRNTDDYRKLDRGLRSIADSFIGTVVVTIWNGRAYRIQ